MATAFASRSRPRQGHRASLGARHRPCHRSRRDDRPRLAARGPLALRRPRRAPGRAVVDRRAPGARDGPELRAGLAAQADRAARRRQAARRHRHAAGTAACRACWRASRPPAPSSRWTSIPRRWPGRGSGTCRPASTRTTGRPHPADNRWQRGEVVDALYFADSEETVWAEWYRFLAEAGLPPRQALPRDLWRWRIELPEVADLQRRRPARARRPPAAAAHTAAVAGLPGRRRAAARGRLAGAGQRLGGAAGGPDAVRVPDRPAGRRDLAGPPAHAR